MKKVKSLTIQLKLIIGFLLLGSFVGLYGSIFNEIELYLKIILGVISVIGIVCAIGLINKKELSRKLSVGFFVILIINLLIQIPDFGQIIMIILFGAGIYYLTKKDTKSIFS
ncbi:hypothetical protein HYW99_03615 [Candidatus Woesearchaeota archaeon]|nr:hypothetical protein [Candidatus Woesearchaeota archaeon]